MLQLRSFALGFADCDAGSAEHKLGRARRPAGL
jgi:hypothetical protein